MLGERCWFLQHLRQGPKSSRRSQGWSRHFRLRPDNIYTALGIPGSYLLISTFSVKPFVQQLHLFSCNLPEEDVPCRLFIFTPTAWIQAENHKIFWLLFSGGFEPHGERVWTWREQPGWVGWIWKKISHGLLLYKAASMLILKYWYWGDLFAWIKRILWKALLGGLELCVWCWKSMIFCLSSF